MEQDYEQIFESIAESDGRYSSDAYEFVMDALTFTQKKMKAPRHVTGDELLDGIKNLLLKKFGPMTMTMLEHWGVKSTEDFGNIVFNLVENKVLTKTEDDSIESFRDRYDFDKVFREGYRKRLHKSISRLR